MIGSAGCELHRLHLEQSKQTTLRQALWTQRGQNHSPSGTDAILGWKNKWLRVPQSQCALSIFADQPAKKKKKKLVGKKMKVKEGTEW